MKRPMKKMDAIIIMQQLAYEHLDEKHLDMWEVVRSKFKLNQNETVNHLEIEGMDTYLK